MPPMYATCMSGNCTSAPDEAIRAVVPCSTLPSQGQDLGREFCSGNHGFPCFIHILSSLHPERQAVKDMD